MDVDWSMQMPARFDNNQFSIGVKGLFFPEVDGEIAPANAPPVMPLQDSKSSSKI